MYLIVGLGNPENEYSNTRHNMGFNVINEIAKNLKLELLKNKFEGLYLSTKIEDEKVILLKPQTYMNLSGDSIIKFKNFYKIPEEKIIVIYDDIDLDIGNIRIRKNGGAGTHNGMRSVIDRLNTQNFARIRIGIGKPTNKDDLINYVTGKIPKEEANKLEQSVKIAADATIEIIKNGVENAMNKFNGKES